MEKPAITYEQATDKLEQVKQTLANTETNEWLWFGGKECNNGQSWLALDSKNPNRILSVEISRAWKSPFDLCVVVEETYSVDGWETHPASDDYESEDE